MGRNKASLQIKGFDEYMAKLDKIGGTNAMKKGVEEALLASKDLVTPKIESAMAKLPAQGKYSTGRTKASINTDAKVEWAGLVASINVGFNLKQSGSVSIFLMYGTPRNKPVSGLKNAVYGSSTQKEIARLQGEALDEVIKSIMEG